MEDKNWVRFIQELRRSSASSPIRSKKVYTRKSRSAKAEDRT